MSALFNRRPQSVFEHGCQDITQLVDTSDTFLFDHQKEALRHLRAWFSHEQTKDIAATVVVPTGAGKTGIAVVAPYFLANLLAIKSVLLVTPSKVITRGMMKALNGDTRVGLRSTFLGDRLIACQVPESNLQNIIADARYITNKKTMTDALLKGGYIVSNAHKFAFKDEALEVLWQDTFKNGTVQLVIIDEAHHLPANTWKAIVEFFKGKAKIVFLTATPYDDEMHLDDAAFIDVYKYAYFLPRRDAITRGIIRDFRPLLQLSDAPDPAIVATMPDTAAKKKLYLETAYKSIIESIAQYLDSYDRDHPFFPSNSPKHRAIVAAVDKAQANRIAELCQEYDQRHPNGCLNAVAYHSKQNDSVLTSFEKGNTRVLIVCKMLLEGYDNPPIAIAAIMTNIVSPIKYSQFVGRAVRTVRKGGEVETRQDAMIITHTLFKQGKNDKTYRTERLIRHDHEYMQEYLATLRAEDEDIEEA